MIARRSFLIGLGALVSAPMIVRAGSLMPVKAEPVLKAYWVPNRSFESALGQIQREAILLFKNCNEELKRIEKQYEHLVPTHYIHGVPYRNGDQVRVAMPCEFKLFPNSGDNALGLVPAST